jgi:hypothetical protein
MCYCCGVFIHTTYLSNNYMFRPFFRSSSGWSFIPYEATTQYAASSLSFLPRYAMLYHYAPLCLQRHVRGWSSPLPIVTRLRSGRSRVWSPADTPRFSALQYRPDRLGCPPPPPSLASCSGVYWGFCPGTWSRPQTCIWRQGYWWVEPYPCSPYTPSWCGQGQPWICSFISISSRQTPCQSLPIQHSSVIPTSWRTHSERNRRTCVKSPRLQGLKRCLFCPQ